MSKELTDLIETKFADLATFQDKAKADIEAQGVIATETKSALETIQGDLDALKVQLEKRENNNTAERKSLQDDFKENESIQRLVRDGRGVATLSFKSVTELERKATITSSAVGSATSGILQYERTPGVVPLARKRVFVRDLLNSVPTTFNAIDYVKITSAALSPSMQTEASAKQEGSMNFSTETANVRTLACWIPASKQVLDDFAGLEAIIRDELLYQYRDIEEQQILSGAGTGQNLNGLVTQATSFSTALLGSAFTKVDQVRRIIQQVASANETPVDWVALNPVDWADIELTKSDVQSYGGGQYIVGTPRGEMMAPLLWRRSVLETNNLSSGTFLAGNTPGCVIRDREGVNIEISTEHSDYFTKNLVAIRIEGRLALVVYRPGSYITGSFTTSP